MSKLLHVLKDLALDPKKQRVFMNNPSVLMDGEGLTEAEQTAMLSKEAAKIAALFADNPVPLAITSADPGPDPLPDPDPFPLPDPPSPPEDPKPDSN